MKTRQNRYSFISPLFTLFTLACICPSCICGGGSEPPPIAAPIPIQSNENNPSVNPYENEEQGFISSSDGLETLIELATEDLNNFWGANIENYYPPKGPIAYTNANSQKLKADCPLLPNSAIYCPGDDTIYYDYDFMDDLLANDEFIPVMVIAHEWGHVIQTRWKLDQKERHKLVVELEADCLAGAYTKGSKRIKRTIDLDETLNTLFTFGDHLDINDPQAHGEPDERLQAFDKGRLQGIRSCRNYTTRGLEAVLNASKPRTEGVEPSEPADAFSAEATDHLNLGQAAINEGDFDTAVKEYNKAIDLDPQNINAHFNRAWCYANLAQYEQAIVGYNKVIELDPKDVDAYREQGFANYNLGKYEMALADFDAQLKINPRDKDSYHGRGLTNYMLDKIDKSIADYDKAIQIDPNYVWAYLDRGVSYNNGKQNKKQALSDYTKAIELKPDYDLAYRNRGSVYQDMGEKSKAIADYKKALELTTDPEIISFVKEQLKVLEP